MKKLETLTFKKFCMSIGNLPSSYVESLSYYECLLWLIKYLQEEVIPTVNNNSEAVTELQNLFVELQNYVNNYFENLDVQDEINNKLDEMVESGELQDLLLDYSTVEKVYSTHEELLEDTNLKSGSRCKTLGFYEPNDGGGAFYIITDTTPSGYYETLNNGLYAVLINDGTVNVNQLGAKGDGETDDSSLIQTAINNFNNVIFLDKTYLLESSISVTTLNPLSIQGINSNSKIKVNSNIYAFEFSSIKDKVIKNLYFDINNGGGILQTTNSSTDFDFAIKDINCEVRTSNSEIIKVVNTHHLKIENCHIVNKSLTYTPTCINLDGVVNGTISKNNFSYFEKGIHITNISGYTNEGIIISENLFYQNKNQIISDNSNNILFYDINNNIFDYCDTYGIKLQNVESSIIANNYIGLNNANCIGVYIRQINNNHTDLSINENKFINYLETMTNPFIKINDVGDHNQSGLKITGNGATGYKTFAEINEASTGEFINNTSSTSISPNNYLTGNSLANMNYKNNLNGGSPKYLHYRIGDNHGIFAEFEDVKSSMAHDTFYKPSNSNGFYLYITFANTSNEAQTVNLILSKDNTNNLLIGNQSIPANAIYSNVSVFVPAGYSFKYNTATPSAVIIQNAHAIY